MAHNSSQNNNHQNRTQRLSAYWAVHYGCNRDSFYINICSLPSPASRETPPTLNMKLISCLLALTGLTAVSATVAIVVPTITVSTSLGTTLAALGLIKLKTAALLALSRNRRSTNEKVKPTSLHFPFYICYQEKTFEDVSKLEDQQCVRRFLCAVASGELSAPEYLNTVESLKAENLNLLIGSAELPYSEAVKYGSKVKSLKQCEAKYLCQQTSQQILLAAGLQGA